MHLGSVGVSRNGGRTAKGWNIAICMLLASVLGLCLMLWITPPVHADDSAGLGITATDDITDTQNLLGSNVSGDHGRHQPDEKGDRRHRPFGVSGQFQRQGQAG